MTILEALRSGTPVVATDSLGIAEKCRKYGAARITDGSPAALAEAVYRILSDDKEADSLRVGGHNLLRDELDINAVAERLEELYAERVKG